MKDQDKNKPANGSEPSPESHGHLLHPYGMQGEEGNGEDAVSEGGGQPQSDKPGEGEPSSKGDGAESPDAQEGQGICQDGVERGPVSKSAVDASSYEAAPMQSEPACESAGIGCEIGETCNRGCTDTRAQDDGEGGSQAFRPARAWNFGSQTEDPSPDAMVPDQAAGVSACSYDSYGYGHDPSHHNLDLGKRGEDAAAAFLVRRGFNILARNYQCAAGEADIVAEFWDGAERELHFVEVKTRTSTYNGFPEEAVDERKRRRYERISEIYLSNFGQGEMRVTFDIISILVTGEHSAYLRMHSNVLANDCAR